MAAGGQGVWTLADLMLGRQACDEAARLCFRIEAPLRLTR
jgi:hypothetical protein